jgi:hypothetical protein
MKYRFDNSAPATKLDLPILKIAYGFSIQP